MTFHGVGVDIFWNCTTQKCVQHDTKREEFSWLPVHRQKFGLHIWMQVWNYMYQQTLQKPGKQADDVQGSHFLF